MTLAARCLSAPPHCGERPSGNDSAVTQGQVSDHPSQANKTSIASQGGHGYRARSEKRTSQALSSMISTALLCLMTCLP